MRLLDREVGGGHPLFVIAGPCVIESAEMALLTADRIAGIADRTGVQIIYKSSFDKANRTSGSSYRGPGMDEGLRILESVRFATGLPILTDIHEISQIAPVCEVADVIQTPAFLARQTDFIQACANSGKPVNIKKGQFMAPGDMAHVVEKCGTADVMVCERGTSFGYGNLVVDMRGLDIMRETGRPVVFDATHSCQLPSAAGGKSGGQRQFVAPLSRAAVAAGIDGIFIETHPDPDNALSDGPNSWPLDRLEELIRGLVRLHYVAWDVRADGFGMCL